MRSQARLAASRNPLTNIFQKFHCGGTYLLRYPLSMAFSAMLCILGFAMPVDPAEQETTASHMAAKQQTTAARSPTSTSVLWSSDFETGDLSDSFYTGSKLKPAGGGIFNSGIAESVASQDFAHSGTWSLKATITTSHKPTSGTRMFRWRESQDARYFASGLYYSAWFLFPRLYTLTADPQRGQFWNIFQFKSKTSSRNDPVWFLDVANRGRGGAMYLTLHWWERLAMDGPHAGESGGRRYTQNVADIPVERWIHIEAYLKQAADFTGEVTVWQDGALLFDQKRVKTKYTSGDNQWAVNNYSDGLMPNPATIYIDDVSVAVERTER